MACQKSRHGHGQNNISNPHYLSSIRILLTRNREVKKSPVNSLKFQKLQSQTASRPVGEAHALFLRYPADVVQLLGHVNIFEFEAYGVRWRYPGASPSRV